MRRSCLALLLLAGPLPASPRDALLRYVPPEAGFVAVATDLPRHAAALGASPFAALVAKGPLGKAAKGKEWAEILKAAELVRGLVKLSWAEIAEVVPGEAAAFVYRPGPPGKPEQEQGLFLLRSRNAKGLASLIDALNAVQKAKLEQAEHKGIKYVRRVEKKDKTFYLLSGATLAFSAQEEMLKRAIEAELSLAKGAAPPVARRLKELGLEGCPLAVVADPRAFDALLAAPATPEGKALAAYWKSLDAVGLGLRLDRDASLRLAFAGGTSKLPAAGRKFFEATVKASALWSVIPEQPLLAVAGQIDLAGLYAALSELMPAANREALEAEMETWIGSATGKNVVKELLPALGPDWGAWLAAPGPKEALPRMAAALKAAPGASAEPVDEALVSAMQTWAGLGLLKHNRAHPEDKARLVAPGDRDRLRRIESKSFPTGISPAWGLRGGCLVLGSSPAALAGIKAVDAKQDAKAPVPLLRVSFKAWSKYVAGQRDGLAALLAKRDGLKKEEAASRLDGLLQALSLLDRLELTREASAGKVAFTLRLRLAAPLLK